MRFPLPDIWKIRIYGLLLGINSLIIWLSFTSWTGRPVLILGEFTAYIFFGTFLFFLFLSATKTEVLAIFTAEICFNLLSIYYPISNHFFGLGVGTNFMFLRRWLAAVRNRRPLEHVQPAFILILTQLFLLLQTNTVLMVGRKVAEAYDHYVIAFDRSLGFDLSAALGKLVLSSNLLYTTLGITYTSLPLALVTLYYFCYLYPEKSRFNVAYAFFLVGIFSLFYYAFPTCGPKQIFDDLFPYFIPADYKPFTENVPKDLLHSAMPSLHAAWVWGLFFCALDFHPLVIALTSLYVFLTFIATMAGGDHYLVDLIVGTPITTCALAICIKGISPHMRMAAFATGLAQMGIWFWLLLQAELWRQAPIALPWACMAVTLFLNIRLIQWMRHHSYKRQAERGIVLLPFK